MRHESREQHDGESREIDRDRNDEYPEDKHVRDALPLRWNRAGNRISHGRERQVPENDEEDHGARNLKKRPHYEEDRAQGNKPKAPRSLASRESRNRKRDCGEASEIPRAESAREDQRKGSDVSDDVAETAKHGGSSRRIRNAEGKERHEHRRGDRC